MPPPPNRSVLEEAISACYQASLLREEERPITFRLALTEPELCPSELGPPGGLHRLEFAESRPFDEHELRRLSPAADFHRSLIGVAVGEEERLRIWGILQTRGLEVPRATF